MEEDSQTTCFRIYFTPTEPAVPPPTPPPSTTTTLPVIAIAQAATYHKQDEDQRVLIALVGCI